jgi:hypothetical protein
MMDKAAMLKSRLANVLTYLKHGITNAASEGFGQLHQRDLLPLWRTEPGSVSHLKAGRA